MSSIKISLRRLFNVVSCQKLLPFSADVDKEIRYLHIHFYYANKDINGIEIATDEHTLSQYEDDTTVLLDGSEKSLYETLITLDSFAKASGL